MSPCSHARRATGTLVVWAVGPNLIDDGGRAADPDSVNGQPGYDWDDVVIRLRGR